MNLDHLVELEYGWGHLPPTNHIFDFFELIQDRFEPTNILEIGFHLGHSTTYLLEIFEQAKVTTVSPGYETVTKDVLERQKKKIKGEVPEDLEKHTADTRAMMAKVMKEKYGDRFNWVSQKTILAYSDLEKSAPFDLALIDGAHTYHNTVIDLKCCLDFGVKQLMIDNIDQPDVLLAVKNSGWEISYIQPYSQGKDCNAIAFLEY